MKTYLASQLDPRARVILQSDFEKFLKRQKEEAQKAVAPRYKKLGGPVE